MPKASSYQIDEAHMEALKRFYRRNFRDAEVVIENKVIGAAVGAAIAGFGRVEGSIESKLISGVVAGVAAGVAAWLTPNKRVRDEPPFPPPGV